MIMKKNLIFVLSLFLFVTFGWMVSPGLSTENPRILVPDWIEYWGGNDSDRAHSVILDNGGIYVGGLTSRYGTSGRFDAILLKYDTDGKILWNRTWGGKDIDLAKSVSVASKAIYVAGTTKSYGDGDKEAFLLKYDINGILLWNHTWGGSENDTAYSVFADDEAVSDFVNKDDLIIAGATHYMLNRYQAFEEAEQWRKGYDAQLTLAIRDDKHRPDITMIPRGTSVYGGGVSGEPWRDPFVRRT